MVWLALRHASDRIVISLPTITQEAPAAIRIPCPPPELRTAYLKYQIHERPTLGLAVAMETPDEGVTITAALHMPDAARPSMEVKTGTLRPMAVTKRRARSVSGSATATSSQI